MKLLTITIAALLASAGLFLEHLILGFDWLLPMALIAGGAGILGGTLYVGGLCIIQLIQPNMERCRSCSERHPLDLVQ